MTRDIQCAMRILGVGNFKGGSFNPLGGGAEHRHRTVVAICFDLVYVVRMQALRKRMFDCNSGVGKPVEDNDESRRGEQLHATFSSQRNRNSSE